MSVKFPEFRGLEVLSGDRGIRRPFVHRVMPTLATTYPHSLAAVSLVSPTGFRTLILEVERGEGHWRQRHFKPESREDPRRGRGQRQAALAEGKSSCPAASGQLAGRTGGGVAHGAASRFERSTAPAGDVRMQNGSRKGEGRSFADGNGRRADSDFETADQPDRSDVARRR